MVKIAIFLSLSVSLAFGSGVLMSYNYWVAGICLVCCMMFAILCGTFIKQNEEKESSVETENSQVEKHKNK